MFRSYFSCPILKLPRRICQNGPVSAASCKAAEIFGHIINLHRRRKHT